MLLKVVAQFAERLPRAIIEPAHMELAEPSIATAFGRCVRRGARRVVIHPYFLLPGRHWSQDIPRWPARLLSNTKESSIWSRHPWGSIL